jgi:hypothetical protein
VTIQDIERLETKARGFLEAGTVHDHVYHADIMWLTSEVRRLRDAITDMRNNLGIPQPGYPAPVAVAYKIGSEALEG